ncbi:MAG: UDP-N-acetylmuramoyl-L-alanine--D-glutamate ligase [Anaerohalosphaeraceae bacterium]|nr:UDP-N-acetylmuramoyl-L-alanine--D-glutamate ligase [Anaerohalosphaeraceae bacterium]
MTGMLSGKTVLVMGLGKFGGGADSAAFAAKDAKKVIVTDKAPAEKFALAIKSLQTAKNIEFHFGGHTEKDFFDCDVVIVNPAVPSENKFLKIARQNGKIITSQVELFFQLCPAKIIGVTGSNGKSTTTALTAHLLKNTKDQNRRVFLGGNIGKRPLLEILEQIKPDDIVVLELSSFQLEQLAETQKSPHISCITNIAPNHLDRHKTMARYVQAKENIFRFQESGNFAIFNASDKQCVKWFEKYNPRQQCLMFDAAKLDNSLADKFKLPGTANRQNLAAAIAICKCLGINNDTLTEAIATFEPLPHRLELVSEKDGVKWYNDSISTTPESTIVALEAFAQPKILIAGGYDKGLSFAQLAKVIAGKAKVVILLGQTANKIADAIEKVHLKNKPKVFIAGSLENAVGIARENSAGGDIVLLSPACASYDMFENFEQRGNDFIQCLKH